VIEQSRYEPSNDSVIPPFDASLQARVRDCICIVKLEIQATVLTFDSNKRTTSEYHNLLFSVLLWQNFQWYFVAKDQFTKLPYGVEIVKTVILSNFSIMLTDFWTRTEDAILLRKTAFTRHQILNSGRENGNDEPVSGCRFTCPAR
jgi:hypothetical protein